jgi:S1-C subfamily serine protease
MKLIVPICILYLLTSATAITQTHTAKKKTPSPAPQNNLQQLPFADARNMTLMIFFADAAPHQGMLPIAHAQASGSGVWIGKTGYVATCYHVIESWRHGPFKIGFARSAYVSEGTSSVTIEATVNLWDADLVASDPSSDVAILKAHISPGKAEPEPLVTGSSLGGTMVTRQTPLSPKGATLRTEFPGLGETLLLAGYPLGERTLILQTGSATGIDFPPSPDLRHGASGLRIFLSLVSNPGNSGGPVLDADGKVIGLLEGNLPSPIRDELGRQVYSPKVKLDANGQPTRDPAGQPQFEIIPLQQNSRISLAVPARFIAELAGKNQINLD